jgi:FKBP-type peptidyl-prolyl cis-trans isomerase SlyD
MLIRRDAWVVLDYVLYDEDGDVLEATDDEEGRPLGFVWGYGFMVPGLERALEGMKAGDTKELVIPPEEAYGARDEALEHWVDRADFPEGIEVDDEFGAESEDGEEITLRVVEIAEDAVLVDANHPLAGETLRFEVMVRSVRPATAEEIGAARAVAPKKKLALVTTASTSAAAQPPPETRAETAPAPASERAPEPGGGTHPPGKGLRKERRRGRSPEKPLPAELEDEQ